VKLRHLSPAVFVALLVASAYPAVLRADTIYYRKADVASIQTVSGTIVREANGRLEIATTDGRTVSIARGDVFQIVRGGPAGREAPAANAPAANAQAAVEAPAPGQASKSLYVREAPAAQESMDQVEIPAGFSAASELARRSSLDDDTTPLRPVSVHYGLKGGLSTSNMRADPQELEDSGSLRGYAFGIWWGMPLWNRLTFQTEALFSMKGDSESAGGYTASTHLSYIDVPLLAKFGFLPNSVVQPSLFVGPSLGFNVSAHSGLEGEGGEVDMDVKDQVGTFDLGLVIGGGVDFGRGGRTYGVDVRYSKGLRDVAESEAGSAHNEAIYVMGSIGLR
jgi:outer membrane protein with beta-barrel domain